MRVRVTWRERERESVIRLTKQTIEYDKFGGETSSDNGHKKKWEIQKHAHGPGNRQQSVNGMRALTMKISQIQIQI